MYKRITRALALEVEELCIRHVHTSIRQIKHLNGRNTEKRHIWLSKLRFWRSFTQNCIESPSAALWYPTNSNHLMCKTLHNRNTWAPSLTSVILLIVADEAPSLLTRLSLPEEGLSDGLQLGQLQADLLQVEGAAVLNLSHRERVHVTKGDVHQLPGKKTVGGMFFYFLFVMLCVD